MQHKTNVPTAPRASDSVDVATTWFDKLPEMSGGAAIGAAGVAQYASLDDLLLVASPAHAVRAQKSFARERMTPSLAFLKALVTCLQGVHDFAPCGPDCECIGVCCEAIEYVLPKVGDRG